MRVDSAIDMPGHPFGDQERTGVAFELVDDPGNAFRAALGVKADDIGEREGGLIDDVIIGIVYARATMLTGILHSMGLTRLHVEHFNSFISLLILVVIGLIVVLR